VASIRLQPGKALTTTQLARWAYPRVLGGIGLAPVSWTGEALGSWYL